MFQKEIPSAWTGRHRKPAARSQRRKSQCQRRMTERRWQRHLVFASCLTLLTAPTARAQTVGGVLDFLVTNQSIATGSVERDRAAAQAASDAMSRALLGNLATLPVSTSSGAF